MNSGSFPLRDAASASRCNTNTFCRCGRGSIDAAIGVDGCPDGRRAQTQGDDDEQAGDELKHEAHAITPRLVEDANSTAISFQLQAGDDAQIGKFSQRPAGICLWTAPAASDLTKGEGPFSGQASDQQLEGVNAA